MQKYMFKHSSFLYPYIVHLACRQWIDSFTGNVLPFSLLLSYFMPHRQRIGGFVGDTWHKWSRAAHRQSCVAPFERLAGVFAKRGAFY